ncbi:MAG: 4Fe-4S dicluster domain-containing protein [Deltaproteobacteria bacterium]|nr:4Fe-4S dicluster domain-containing protein [Deltaproteobacteria bacterium]
MAISRRGFLKGGLTAAGTLAVKAAPLPASVKGLGPGELATLLDLEKCIGCEACVEACAEVNGHKFPNPKKPFPEMAPVKRVKVADWSDKQDVNWRLTPYNWLTIQHAQGEYNGKPYYLTIPRRCMHCTNPPCADMCPFGAARKLGNGITRIHSELCLGGAKCKAVCPWHIPERQTGVGLYLKLLPSYAGNGVMYKCDCCYDRVAQGKLPACIEVCPVQLQTIGPREKIKKQAYALAKERGGFVYGDKENGGTNTFYVSPVPFEVLNKDIEKGPGKPHFGPVKNAMQRAENLGKAMIIAPLAGAAAAALRFGRFFAGNGDGHKRGEEQS